MLDAAAMAPSPVQQDTYKVNIDPNLGEQMVTAAPRQVDINRIVYNRISLFKTVIELHVERRTYRDTLSDAVGVQCEPESIFDDAVQPELHRIHVRVSHSEKLPAGHVVAVGGQGPKSLQSFDDLRASAQRNTMQ